MMAPFSLFLCFLGTCLHWGYVARRGLIQKMVLLCCICPSGSDRIICFASSVLCNVAISAPNWICLLPHRCAVASTMEEIVSQQMIDATRILKTITKIDVTTTRTVNVEQLSRDVRASIGYGNITMSALMTNQYSFPEYLSNLDVIVHITRVQIPRLWMSRHQHRMRMWMSRRVQIPRRNMSRHQRGTVRCDCQQDQQNNDADIFGVMFAD